MPSAIFPTLSAEEIDDLLYLARINAAHDLTAGIEAIAKCQQAAPSDIKSATIDPKTGNSLLHMASANGCMDVLHSLVPLNTSSSSATPALNINLPNSSGNTPLHWAALNGHLEAVKHLVNAGADPAIKNRAGHDAVYEAESGEREMIAAWLFSDGTGLQTGMEGSEVEHQEDEEVIGGKEGQDNEEEQNEDRVKDAQDRVAGMELEQYGP
ncbi:MAG: hypothetical protein LQ346_002196 [Caloplaca aetnensis]|nr:MAG: hypothetical protein LQ346_002196 [Caloplaca aetnensis]